MVRLGWADSGLDYTKITDFFEPATPAYVLVRLDEKDTKGGYNWLFLCYVPDNAKVRDKMLYASTRASLTKSLGDSHFTDSVYGTAEVNGYGEIMSFTGIDKTAFILLLVRVELGWLQETSCTQEG